MNEPLFEIGGRMFSVGEAAFAVAAAIIVLLLVLF
jgi:hypothetical protein